MHYAIAYISTYHTFTPHVDKILCLKKQANGSLWFLHLVNILNPDKKKSACKVQKYFKLFKICKNLHKIKEHSFKVIGGNLRRAILLTYLSNLSSVNFHEIIKTGLAAKTKQILHNLTLYDLLLRCNEKKLTFLLNLVHNFK